MNIDEVISWAAFIAIIFMIYVVPKAYTFKNFKVKKKKKKQPEPLLGVVQPKRKKDK